MVKLKVTRDEALKLALSALDCDYDPRGNMVHQYWYHVAKVRNVGTLRYRGPSFVAIVPLSQEERDIFCPIKRYRYVTVLWLGGEQRIKYHNDYLGQSRLLDSILANGVKHD